MKFKSELITRHTWSLASLWIGSCCSLPLAAFSLITIAPTPIAPIPIITPIIIARVEKGHSVCMGHFWLHPSNDELCIGVAFQSTSYSLKYSKGR